jgi:hypothetical protein
MHTDTHPHTLTLTHTHTHTLTHTHTHAHTHTHTHKPQITQRCIFNRIFLIFSNRHYVQWQKFVTDEKLYKHQFIYVLKCWFSQSDFKIMPLKVDIHTQASNHSVMQFQ